MTWGERICQFATWENSCFWPKGKKYIVCIMKFFCTFYDFFLIIWVILGGVSLLNFFWFEPLFLSYRTNKLQKLRFMRFSRNLNSMKKIFFLQILFFVKFYRCKKSTISYRIFFFFLICSSAGQKTRFFAKNVFFGPQSNNFFFKKWFYSLSCSSYTDKTLQKIKFAKQNFFHAV